MDPITHALSGALLARATAPTRQHQCTPLSSAPYLPLRLRMATGCAAAAFPDFDFALRLIDTLTYLNWHQGPTHSLLMLPFWAWLIAWLGSRLSRGKYTRRQFFAPACLGLAIHIAGDLITSYGLMLFAPFSTERYSLSLVFVIDPWFTLIIISGLLGSWFYSKKKIAAIAALTGLTGYILLLSTLHAQALGIAKTRADTMAHTRIDVLPQPLSPFHWKIIIRQQENYHIARVNLLKTNAQQPDNTNRWLLSKMAAAYRPAAEHHWQLLKQFGNHPESVDDIRQAWLQPVFKPFRAFARFPLLERIDPENGMLCYWFYDLRFKFPQLPPSFIYGVCRKNNESEWQMVRHRGLFYID